MKYNNIIYNNIKQHLNIEVARPNLNAIYSTEWLSNDNPNFINNINKPILPNDVILYLSNLENYHILEFLIGFHAINFQYWTPVIPNGFKPYINDGLSGFYACLASYLSFFKHTEISRRNKTLNQIDFITYFGDIPNSKDRFKFLLDVWNPESLDNIHQIIEAELNEACLSLETAYKISKIIPSCFDDPYFRKSSYLLWDYAFIQNKNNHLNIQTDLPIIADHQTAKILSMNNMMIYNDSLKNKISKGQTIEANSPEELAIRACIVFIGEQIVKRKNIKSNELYQLMWQMRALKNEPFFLCVNNNY